jgi:hypothetical protein
MRVTIGQSKQVVHGAIAETFTYQDEYHLLGYPVISIAEKSDFES